jgi:hypothetical protein
MRRLLTVVAFCVVLAAVAALTTQSVSADNSMMSGSTMMPKDHQYLIGTWACSVKLGAMMGQPAQTVTSGMSIEMSPGMTVHSHVSSKGYYSDTYQGYDMKTKTHWLTTADVLGNAALETSKDGMVFNGTSWGISGTASIRDNYSKVSNTKIEDKTTLKLGGKWTQVADATCTKG